MFDFLCPLVQKLSEPEAAKCKTVFEQIMSPMACWENFLKVYSEAGGEVAVAETEAPETAVPEQSALDKVKADFNKATGSLLELLVDLMQGKYLDDCRELAKDDNAKISEIVSQAAQASQASQSSQNDKACDLAKALCTVVQGFDVNHSKSISLASACPAPSLISTMNDGEGGEALKAKREEIWKQVQSQRRQFVTFSVPKSFSTKDHLSAAFRASGKVHSHSGQLNHSHRLIVASADLITEADTDPWLHTTMPDKSTWKTMAEFCSGTLGPTDFALIFDGRMREARRLNVLGLTLANLQC